MHRLRRRFLALAAVLALSLSGCSVAAGFGADSGGVPGDALCPGKPRAKHITVVNWWQTSTTAPVFEAARRFNCDHPNIAINMSINAQVGDDNNGKLLAATSAGKPPDIVLAFDDVLANWAARGELKPMGALAKQWGFRRQDYIDQAWQSTMWNGRQYGVPFNWDPDALLWYNKKVFRSAGLDPARPPRTWDELQRAAAKIDLVQHGQIKRLGFVPWAGWQFDYIQVGQQWGADLRDGAKPEVRVDSPGMRKLFEFEHQIAKKYGGGAKVNAFVNTAGAQGAAADPLLSGRVGMLLIGDWENGHQSYVGAKKFQETIGVAPMPNPPGGRPYLCHSGWAMMMPSGAQHPQEAMTFIKWLEQPENFAAHLGKGNGWLPARKASRSQPYIASDPIYRQILQIEKEHGYGWWLPPSPILQQYYQILDQAQDALVALDKSPQQALADAQSQIEAALQNAQALGVYRTQSQ